MTFRASALGNNGATSSSATVVFTVPAGAVAGDVADVFLATSLGSGGSYTPPASDGWTSRLGPDAVNANILVQVFSKTLAAGDLGATKTFTVSTSSRIVGVMFVLSGVVEAPSVVSAVTGTTTASTTVATPAVTTTVAGSDVVQFLGLRSGTTSASGITTPSGFTSGGSAIEGTVAAAPAFSAHALYVTSPGAAGSYGGENVTAALSVTAAAYTLAHAPSTAAATAAGSITLGGSVAAAAPATASGTISLGGTVTARAAATSGGVITLGGTATGTAPIVHPSTATGNLLYPRPGQYPRPGLYPGTRGGGGGGGVGLPVDAAELFKQAIRGSVAITYTVDAFLGSTPIVGAQGMAPTGGNIVDTSTPGVRRVLSLDLAPAPGLFDLLSPSGVRLSVTAHVRYTSRAVFDLAMGVFDVDTETLKEGGGGLSLTAPDKWVRIIRAKFVKPQASTKGARVTQQIKTLIQGALGTTEPVVITATSKATVGAMVWESDRAQAIIDLANGIGAWVHFDRQGVATIADLPTVGAATDWLVDASESGVMLSMDRSRSRTSTYNVVAVHSSAASGAAFPDVYVWDGIPSSPTYAGPDPIRHPELAGPFGVVVYHFDTPLPLTVSGARQAGLTVLARTTGLAAQASMGQVPNPAVDAMDVVEVLAPRERRDLARAVERHMVDTVTHNLDVTQPQTLQTRSTRTDAFT